MRFAAVVLLGVTVGAAFAQTDLLDPPSVTYEDATLDTFARPTDPGADNPFDPDAHRLPNLLNITIGKWVPVSAPTDLFIGAYGNSGKFICLQLTLEGLINPPGPAEAGSFDPFRYGNHPIYGFVEIDTDADVETGGEIDAPEFRYVGNVARFGGCPAALPGLENRIALDASAFDGDFTTPPFVDRSGEEFHLALLGTGFYPANVEEEFGDGDLLFEAGETWRINASWFHRAHGYEPFSLASGGAHPGEYAPVTPLEFAHDAFDDVTYITLVFPLTNVGAGEWKQEVPEAPDNDPSNQFSIREGMIDLQESAAFVDHFPTGLPEEAIITEWLSKDPGDYLVPNYWTMTALLGSSYTMSDPAGTYFVWSDVYPDAVHGDVNGDGEADQQDELLVGQYLSARDADDGVVDGQAVLAGFALDFSVFDINQSGAVSGLDEQLVGPPGDADQDNDVDLRDLALMQICVCGPGVAYAPESCGVHDLDTDGDIDGADFRRTEPVTSGPTNE